MTSKAILVAVALAAGIGGGLALERYLLTNSPADAGAPAQGERRILYWWDPMMPEYRSDKPGKSPMGMDMVPVHEGKETRAGGDAGAVTVSPAIVQTLGVRTALAERTTLTPEIRTFGTVGFDESRTSHVHVRAEGWIERLYHRVEGEAVREGAVLFEYFSPNLASAAYEYVRELERSSAPGAEGAARKLLALGMDPRQIEEVRRSREVPGRIKVYAPQSGVVVEHSIAEGMYVQPDMTLMSITDLVTVWVLAEVFESQAALVRPGMDATVIFKSLPGRIWTGSVDYVYPDLRPDTRTVRLRIRLDNSDGTLRPNMYATVWIEAAPKAQAVTVPQEAVIRTGQGARVVLARGEGQFEPVPVRTGLAVGGRIEVTQGIDAGDRVVTSAHFLLDGEVNLSGGLAKLSAPATPAAPPPPIMAEGILKAIDTGSGKLTISHGPVAALNWPAMTMDFSADGLALPGTLQPGDAIRFQVEKAPDGSFRAVEIEPSGGEPGHPGHGAPVIAAWTEATVNTAPGPEGRANLSHGPVPEIGWPAMTMDFAVDPAAAAILRPGARVRIGLSEEPDGSYRIAAAEADGTTQAARAPGDAP